jgi:hypothetical protein
MSEIDGMGLKDLGAQRNNPGERRARAVGSPLPMGGRGRVPATDAGDEPRFRAVPPPGRALTSPPESSSDDSSSGVQWAVGALRKAVPFVQRLLPLLDGHIASSVASLLTPQPSAPASAQTAVDLAPIEDGLVVLETQQRELRNQVAEQNTSLKRVEDQLDMVREATDRNTLEQQELFEDLKSVSNKVNLFALVALALLAVSVLLNVLLLLHLNRVLP